MTLRCTTAFPRTRNNKWPAHIPPQAFVPLPSTPAQLQGPRSRAARETPFFHPLPRVWCHRPFTLIHGNDRGGYTPEKVRSGVGQGTHRKLLTGPFRASGARGRSRARTPRQGLSRSATGLTSLGAAVGATGDNRGDTRVPVRLPQPWPLPPSSQKILPLLQRELPFRWITMAPRDPGPGARLESGTGAKRLLR